jgi:hypothetical protein
LPENIKVVDPAFGRSHRIFSQVDNVTTDFQFVFVIPYNRLTMETSFYIIT